MLYGLHEADRNWDVLGDLVMRYMLDPLSSVPSNGIYGV